MTKNAGKNVDKGEILYTIWWDCTARFRWVFPKSLYVKCLNHKVALLGGGRNFRRWGLMGGHHTLI
jgi:hypothetical protein